MITSIVVEHYNRSLKRLFITHVNVYSGISSQSSIPFQATSTSSVASGGVAAVHSSLVQLALIYSALSSIESPPQLAYSHSTLFC